MGSLKKQTKKNALNPYKKFHQVDGSHSLKEVLTDGYIDYPARIRKGGKVRYFNFALAKEMGLIPTSHEGVIDQDLNDIILETFSIQIINEYDQLKNRVFPESEMKKGTYMATRYLQLQHEDKKGRTSGDGRSVWNGEIKHKGRSWDISSGGTGATRLSPATSKFNRFFETGDPSISYGCGYAELDEGIATAVFSSIFNFNKIQTEQTLAIIDFGNNISINVRANENLLRPSHFFLYLKQDDFKSLKSITDYYIAKESSKQGWEGCPTNKKKYDFFLSKMVDTFSRTVANFEDEYIFCWLDWDGDNILMDGGIIDYGSIRQFGMFHHEYRYDDFERYSTNIIEQKGKARYMVQTFIQLVEYLKTGKKPSMTSLNDHVSLKQFDATFEEQKNLNLLHKVGFSPKKSKQVLKRYIKDVENFRKSFSHFEKTKTKAGMMDISDGITWDAAFNMRTLLRELPQFILTRGEKITADEFMDIMASAYAKEEDREVNSYRKQKINEFQNQYIKLFQKCSSLFQEEYNETLLAAMGRSQTINKADRVTGDAVTYIVDLILKKKGRLSPEALNQLIENFTASQNLDPERKVKFVENYPKGLMKQIFEIVKDYKEGI